MRKAIVTGANGFVGSAVCRDLCKRGIKVIAIVRNSKSDISRLQGLSNIEIKYCELSDIDTLDCQFDNSDFDCFYHFAWTGSAGAQRADYSVQLKNVEYTCNAVKTAKRLGCTRFIFAASIMEYEIQKLMSTDMNIGINTIYSSSKITAEYMSRAVANQEGIEYVGGIISNIFGPGETSPRLVNTTIKKLLLGEYCKFSPGEQLYDFIYVDDAARAFYELGENAKSNKSYYIGSGKVIPLKKYLMKIRDIVSPEVKIGIGDIPFNGISLSYTEFDINELEKDTGFICNVPFEEGIVKTCKWIREEMDK